VLKNASKPHPRPHLLPVFFGDVSYAFSLPSSRLSSACFPPLLSLPLPLLRHRHPAVDTAVVFLQKLQPLFQIFYMPAPDHKTIEIPLNVHMGQKPDTQITVNPKGPNLSRHLPLKYQTRQQQSQNRRVHVSSAYMCRMQ